MTAQELHEMVENIVSRVMQRIEKDSELRHLIKTTTTNAASGVTPSVAAGASGNESRSNAGLVQKQEKKLYIEGDILELARRGDKVLVVSKKTIFTPSALDAAGQKGIQITRE